MTNSKSTKRALVSSALAILMCVAMLIGTTFAWFTDTASTGVNKIQAGTLDVQLLDANGNAFEGQTLAWQKASGHENEEVLWEPGCTYNLQPIVIKNNGTLALKYKIAITGIKGDAELNEAIEWTINDANLGADHSLAAGASHTLTISGHMRETAGNEYQGLSIDGISVTVLATQDTVEHDSFGNLYDASATYDDLPRALVTKLDLTTIPVFYGLYGLTTGNYTPDVAYEFKTTETAAQAAAGKYAAWNGDFVISFDKNVIDVNLFGQYDSFNSDWVGIPLSGISAGTELRLLDAIGYAMTYHELCRDVKIFNCGATDFKGTSDAGTVMTVELRLYEVVSGAETGNYEVIGTYQYTF